MINYYIINTGCDDETYGLVRLPDHLSTSKIVHLETNLSIIREIIQNLNKNSTYSCKPTISIYQIPDSMIRPATNEDIAVDDSLVWGNTKEDILYTNQGIFVLTESIGDYHFQKDAEGNRFAEYVLKEGVIQIV